MNISRTYNIPLIKSIITHEKIWNKVSDDFHNKDSYIPSDSEPLYWLLVKDNEEILGVYLVHPHNIICWEVHTALLPNAWGTRSKECAQLLIKWVFENTSCEKLITNVPEDNLIALRYAKKAGLKEFGINTKSIKKSGKLLDQTLLGIEKGDWLCR